MSLRQTIQQKIILLILPICLIPAAIFLIVVGLGTRVVIEDTIGTLLQHNTAIFTNQFDLYLASQLSQVRADWLEPAQPLSSDTHGLIILHATGDSSATLVRAPRDDSDAEMIRQQVPIKLHGEWELRRHIEKEGLAADCEITTTGRTISLIVFVYPDRGDGLFYVVAKSQLWFAGFQRILTQLPDFFALYSDGGGLVYASNPVSPKTVERIATASDEPDAATWFSVRQDGASYLMAPFRSQKMKVQRKGSGTGAIWTMIVGYNMEIFLGNEAWLIWLSVLIALGVVLMLIMSASVVVRQLMLPLQTLKRQAEMLAQGQLDLRASVQSKDEFGNLAGAFNIMARRLHATYDSLAERAEENRLHAEHIYVINEMANAIILEQSLDSIFDILKRELGRILEFDAIWIALFDGQVSELRVTQIHPMRLISLFDHGRIPLSWSLHGKVIDSKETIYAEVGPRHRTEFFETRIFNAEGFQSYLIAPLPARDGIIGTLTVATAAPDSYNTELLTIVSSLARGVAIAIEHAEMFQQVSRSASELEHKVKERGKELALATQKLIQTEKYFATGRLAGNIAHEINNPLGIIKNYLHLVKSNLQRASGGRRATDPNVEHVRVIDEEVNRIARLVRQMMDLHRPVEQTVQYIDLNSLIADTLSIMEQSLKRNSIEVVREFATDLPLLVASADLIRQVVINLVRNAQDAMDKGGRLTIRTSAITDWEGGAGEGEGRERQLVRMRISDTGCGIATEHLTQIFDPFFTTKPSEKGTGLGLCVSYSILQMYRGTIEVESEVGVGTTFTISLPVVEITARDLIAGARNFAAARPAPDPAIASETGNAPGPAGTPANGAATPAPPTAPEAAPNGNPAEPRSNGSPA